MTDRLLLDLQGCQTANSRHRGIGRYTLSLAEALLRIEADAPEPLNVVGFVNGAFPEAIGEIEDALRDPAPSVLRRYGDPGRLEGPVAEQSVLRGFSAAASARALAPDILHVSSPIEGYEEGAALPVYSREILPGTIRTATVYDLIPRLFPDFYLTNEAYAAWYRGALECLASYDMLFAISEATRRDLIEHLGIAPERVVNIAAAVDSRFRRVADAEAHRARFAADLGLKRPFVLYTGGADHRKNLEGAIEAFALLPRQLRDARQLAIVCRMDPGTRARLLARAKSLGLSGEDVVLTGFVSDDDLVLLYNLAELFVFPSIYEGFGLPLLEAMSCGTPVLAGDNSSLREVVGRADLLFDERNPQAFAAAMVGLIENGEKRAEVAAFGLDRSKLFTWERSARLVHENHREFLARRNAAEAGHRPRVAMLSPLPPARSGISDYTADLLGPLSEHAEVDLFLDKQSLSSETCRNHRARPWERLPEEASGFDAVVYQMGNSTFHTHMLSLLPQTGGILVLHDVYLSNLKAWIDRLGEAPGLFERDLARSHGNAASETLRAKGTDGAIADWPASGPEIAAADAVIVHSNFAATLIRRFHPELADKVSVVRQPRATPDDAGPEARDRARAALGVAEDEFLVVSIGVVSPAKRLDAVVDGFLTAFGSDPKARLVLAGDAADDRWTAQLRAKVAASKGRVVITGHLEAETFGDYCLACDVAVQLRATTRGETSAAVLQLMGCGRPVIVNAYADFADYSSDLVVKLSEQPEPAELAQTLKRLRAMPPAEREAIGARARAFVRERHSHEGAARAYAEVVRRTIRHGRQAAAVDGLTRAAGTALAGHPGRAVETAGRALAAAAPALAAGLETERRLLIDVSHTARHNLKTGIQRVVRELVRSSYAALGENGLNVQAFVRTEDGRFLTADGFALALDGEAPGADIDAELTVRPGDILLMLDSSWFEYAAFQPLFDAVRGAGGRIHTCVFDLVPILYPELTGEALPPAFKRWLAHAAEIGDGLICISRAVADEVTAYIERERLPHRSGLQVNWFHLGSNLPAAGTPSPAVLAAFDGQAPAALMVGTVEVRKRHGFALDVMEALWAEGSPARLVLLGKPGWHVDALTRRIREHAEFGRRLLWIEQPSDADIAHGYDRANLLLFPSTYEGYGLPVAEALRAGLPVVASDIPVLREVGGEAARYAPLGEVEAWVEAVRPWLAGARQTVSGGTVVSWDEAAKQVRLAMLTRLPYKVLD
ncbi:glycosyltransferase [Antarcticirhabdus aurantiaca]|uniref:Glycosyltransferase n=1 Tax=Antarcticirhabdus aurantiaca TaxID=2606717 RepID=A0ACD4NPA4_9HYPH|nr:glycosyltransferase [Antarcticirhabdus aurantiaca]WAJ28701.1 glycosyltransferase [Jeongeuplla avenae]